MTATSIEILATALFALAVVHTFASSYFQTLASKFEEGSVAENVFHMLGEVEVVFGLWAALFLALFALLAGSEAAVHYAEGLNFTEPMFVFAIMTIAATRPIIYLARVLILSCARILPLHRESAIYFSCLVIGPLLGSLVTEPAAMTVTALILMNRYYAKDVSARFRYVSLAVLLVNVSVGGVLTSYAAPPVLMVASKWNWNSTFMFMHFGWRAVLTVVVNATGALIFLRKELRTLKSDDVSTSAESKSPPPLLIGVHIAFLALVVTNAHHPVIFMGLFLLFLGIASITKEFQSELYLKQSLLVAFFLGGLVILGGLQSWWLSPLIKGLSTQTLFFGATALTALTDNAALTYLGSQIDSVSDQFKFAIVAGAVTGGGLTVIANAPNPAAFSILQDSFGKDGISGARLLLAALAPTFAAILFFGLIG